jgi:ribosomal protein S27AE
MDDMEKYGVEQEKAEEKTAQEGTEQRCPRCNSLLEKHGDIRICPTCGSAPFESDATKKT